MWQIAAAENIVIALAYFAIAGAILRGLLATGQLGSNRLATATAAIFFTCAVHHGAHTVHMLLPAVGLELRAGHALRASVDGHVAIWDAVGAAVGVYYWTLRASYSSLLRGPSLFADEDERHRQVIELNDVVLQQLTAARLALELGDIEGTRRRLDETFDGARALVTGLLEGAGPASTASSAAGPHR